MVLNSVTFLLFFAVIFILYYTIFKKQQQLLLLIASVIFLLTYKAECLVMVLLISAFTYGTARVIAKGRYAKAAAVSGTVATLAVLFVFKYLNFTMDVAGWLSEKTGIFQGIQNIPALYLLLPAGISFYIFQSVGYIWDVYTKRIEAEQSFGRYFLFISYFPKLTVGPIERGKNLLLQFGGGNTSSVIMML